MSHSAGWKQSQRQPDLRDAFDYRSLRSSDSLQPRRAWTARKWRRSPRQWSGWNR